MTYDVLLADCPWPYGNQATRASTDKHYPTMSLDEIKAMPVGDLGNIPCALFLWATWPNLRMAWEVLDAWGFEYKTIAWVWVKQNQDGGIFKGMGNYTRSNTEPCLLAFKKVVTRSRIIRPDDKSISSVLMAQRRKHSQKPDEQYDIIERMYPGRRYLELFARQKWPGWDAWGKEVEGGMEIEWLIT